MSSVINAGYKKNDIWSPWKCVSLTRTDGKTLDFVIGDDNSMMVFIHVFYKLICKPDPKHRILRDFKLNKIKMKLR